MSALALVNGTIVNEGELGPQDLLIEGDRIARIGAVAVPHNAEVLDLTGQHILPGLIDDQVHFREPGLTHKADIGSESLAAICGGVTSFLDMPNNSPPCVDLPGLAAKREIAARTSYANYGFYLGATNTNIEEVRRATAADACGIKVFMGASTGNMLVDDDDALSAIFADAQLPVVTHCEDTPMILAAEADARRRYGADVPMSEHPKIRSAEACVKSSTRAVELARRHGTRLHVLHLTTARELALFDSGPIASKRITAEVCVHHLWFDDTDYARLGTAIKCNPAIKTRQDRDALRRAVLEDVIDVIATDHAPHTKEEKAADYFSAPAGLPLVQHLLPMLLDLAAEGFLDLPTIARKTAHNPATLFGIRERGYIREGSLADLTVVDLNRRTTVEAAGIRYKCGWSPLEGRTLRGAVTKTILNGRVVYDGERIIGRHAGRALEFAEGGA